MLLKFFGSDSGFGDNNTCAYFESGDRFILIDCGFTVFNKLKNLDFSKYNTIDIIITHLHNDHAGSLSQVILYLWFIHHKKVNVISKCKYIKEYLEITGTAKDAYTISNSYPDLTFIKVPHAKELDAYGFKIKLGDKNIIYTGDTSSFEPFKPYIDDTNELYMDMSKNGGVHLKLSDTIDELNNLKDKNIDIFLIHTDDKEYMKNSVPNNIIVVE